MNERSETPVVLLRLTSGADRIFRYHVDRRDTPCGVHVCNKRMVFDHSAGMSSSDPFLFWPRYQLLSPQQKALVHQAIDFDALPADVDPSATGRADGVQAEAGAVSTRKANTTWGSSWRYCSSPPCSAMIRWAMNRPRPRPERFNRRSGAPRL